MKWIKNQYYLWLNRRIMNKIIGMRDLFVENKISSTCYNAHLKVLQKEIMCNLENIKL